MAATSLIVAVVECFSLISPPILNQFPFNFASPLCKYSGTWPENFVKFNGLFQKLDHLTCSGISRLKPIEVKGFIEERHNSQFTA